MEAVGSAVLDELALALPHDASALYVVDDGALVLRAQRGPVAIGADALLGYAERASSDRRAYLVDDATADHPSLAEVPLHGIVAAPLVAEDRAIGAIVVASKLRSRYDRDDQRLLEVIATVAGLAYASLRLLDAMPDAV
jgi:GAF domain-containing protein